MKKYLFFIMLGLGLHIHAQMPGDLDVNFLQTGIAYMDYAEVNNHFTATAIQSDGKMVVAGEASGHPFIGRLLANGNWDMSFGTGGIWTDFQSPMSGLSDIAIAADGKIYATGYEDINNVNSYVIVISLGADGALNTAFGSNGYIKKDIHLGKDFGKTLLIQSDGKILVGGGATYTSPTTGITTIYKFIFRVDANGGDDTVFGAGAGYVSPQAQYGYVSDLAIANGIIAVSYASAPYVSYYESITAISYLDIADGLEVDHATCNYYAGSGKQGLSRIAFATDGTLWAAITYQPNTSSSPETDFYKINPNISNGTFNIFSYTNYFQEVTAILPFQGGFFAAGPANGGGKSDIILLNSSGLLDFGFATQGKFETDPVYNGHIRDMKFTPNGKLFAVGISPSIYHANTQSIEDDGFAMMLHTQLSSDIDDIHSEIGLSVYPNPANAHVTIIWDKPLENVALSIVDMQGKTHFVTHISTHVSSFSLPLALAPGIYFVTLATDAGIFTQKLSVY